MMYVAELTPPSESEETVMMVPAGCQDGFAVYRKGDRLTYNLGTLQTVRALNIVQFVLSAFRTEYFWGLLNRST
jgi:hypothetical protein